jgi:hypothetical protein
VIPPREKLKIGMRRVLIINRSQQGGVKITDLLQQVKDEKESIRDRKIKKLNDAEQ